MKPEYWTDPVIVELTPWARLLYIGLWNLADEWGVLRDEPRRIKLELLPADDIAVSDLLDELTAAGRVVRATTPNGVDVLVIPRFRDHQKTDPRLQPRFGDPTTYTLRTATIRTNKHQQTPTRTDKHPSRARIDMGQGTWDMGHGTGGNPSSTAVDTHTPPADPLEEFEPFWQTWPTRGGKRLNRGKAQAQWRRLTTAERHAATIGAGHYALACQLGTQGAKDAFRWLRDREWDDWQTPPTVNANGARASPAGPRPTRGDVAQRYWHDQADTPPPPAATPALERGHDP